MLKHDPGNVDLHRWLIRLLAQQGLTGDAHRELEKAVGGGVRFPSDEKKIEFLRQAAECLPKNPLPGMLIADTLVQQRKFFEAATELEKVVDFVIPSGLTAEFARRLSQFGSLMGDNPDLAEAAGFLWIRIRRAGDGLPLLSRAAMVIRKTGEEHRARAVDPVLEALRSGRDEAVRGAMSFREAAERLAGRAPGAPVTPPPPAAPTPGPPPAAPPPPERPPAEPTAAGPPSSAPPAAPGGTVPPPATPVSPSPSSLEDERIVQDIISRLQAKIDEEIGDKDPEARYNLGIAYKEMGLLDEALGEFRIARRRRSLFVGASTLMAEVLHDKGDVDGAVAVLDEVLASDAPAPGESRDVLYQKGQILSRGGREGEALEVFTALYRENPDYRDVRARVTGRGR